MILIDSTYVNSGGGKVLLNYYLTRLSIKSDTKNILIVDSRIDLDLDSFNNSFIIHTIVASELNRLMIFKSLCNKYSLSAVISFNNIPPPIKIENIPVYIYFHNVLFINLISFNRSFYLKILNNLKFSYIKLLNRKNYIWMVQTTLVKDRLSYEIDNSILTVPFFELSKNINNQIHRSNKFLYVADGNIHKNHDLLFEAFYILSKEYGLLPELVITIDPVAFPALNDKIIKCISLGLNINNVGVVSSEKVNELYQMAKFVIYPSLSESFGLPLIEAVNYGCKLLCIDLPYIYEVVKPSIVFNDGDAEHLALIIKELFLKNIVVADSEIVVQNQIDRLINL